VDSPFLKCGSRKNEKDYQKGLEIRVVWVRTDAPGSRDQGVLARAVTEERISLTIDKDFGELAFHSKLPASRDVILFRVTAPSSKHLAHLIISAIETDAEWVGNFAVVEQPRIRVRPISRE
jgi:predicted nuclease of predicted toxin-antitoxin system